MRINNNKEIKFENNKNWLLKELRQTRTKRMIKAYVTMLMNGEIDYNQLGIIWKPTELIPEASVKRILKYKEVQDMIDIELEQTLIKNNVTKDYLIGKRKEIIDLAKDKDKLDIMLKAVEGFENMYNMQNLSKKEVKTISETINYKQLLDSGEQNSLTLSQTRPAESAEMEEFTDKTLDSEV